MFANILVPLDGSALSEQALPMAQHLARSSHTSLHLLQVISLRPELEALRGSGSESVTVLEMAQDAARRLREAQTARGKAFWKASRCCRPWACASVWVSVSPGRAETRWSDGAPPTHRDDSTRSACPRGGAERVRSHKRRRGACTSSLSLVSLSLCCVLWGISGAVSVRLSTNHGSAGRSQTSMEQEDPS
jgi:hypothetical protein